MDVFLYVYSSEFLPPHPSPSHRPPPMLQCPHCSTTRGWSVHLGPMDPVCAPPAHNVLYTIQLHKIQFISQPDKGVFRMCERGAPPQKNTRSRRGRTCCPIIPPEDVCTLRTHPVCASAHNSVTQNYFTTKQRRI